MPRQQNGDQQCVQTADPRQLLSIPNFQGFSVSSSEEFLESTNSYPSSTTTSVTPGVSTSDTQSLPSPLTPASPLNTGNQSETRPFSCGRGCRALFPSKRELERHYSTFSHQPELYDACSLVSQASFHCACGYVSPRRDNYKRHIYDCARPAKQPYRCNNGHTGTDHLEWFAHLEGPDCKPKRGAPRRRSVPRRVIMI